MKYVSRGLYQIKNMRILLTQLILLVLGNTMTFSQTYRAEYLMTYIRDSSEAEKRRIEKSFLFIENNEKVTYCTEGYLKSDSLKQLVNLGKISAYDIIGNTRNIHQTKYYQLLERRIPNPYFSVHERVSLSYFNYKVFPNLEWRVSIEKKQILNYTCTKAATSYAGRKYIAWFTPDIPISTGPYVFCGLPGLIVEIYDETNSYKFELKEFQNFKGYIPPKPAFSDNSIETSHRKVFEIREDLRKNPLDFESRMYDMESFKGKIPPDRVKYLLSDNNPLELRVD